MEAISHAGSAIGIETKEGIVLAAEKKITSKLLESLGPSEVFWNFYFLFPNGRNSSPIIIFVFLRKLFF
jgi:hypothetical protein